MFLCSYVLCSEYHQIRIVDTHTHTNKLTYMAGTSVIGHQKKSQSQLPNQIHVHYPNLSETHTRITYRHRPYYIYILKIYNIVAILLK